MSGGLLDSINQRLRGEARKKREDAVLVHLSTLLNTRQGSSALDPEYGLPDIVDFTHNIPSAIPALERLIVGAIQRYEPRLSHTVVRSSTVHTDALSLCFEVSAQLLGGGSLRFQTTLSAGGQVSVV
jgi:type VI secretion system protein